MLKKPSVKFTWDPSKKKQCAFPQTFRPSIYEYIVSFSDFFFGGGIICWKRRELFNRQLVNILKAKELSLNI